MNLRALGPFDTVLDVGGNVGWFAQQAHFWWPQARIVSFEPVPLLAEANHVLAAGRWETERIAISSKTGSTTINYCVNQHTVSTMQKPGTLRRDRFHVADTFEPIEISTSRLDDLLPPVGRTLLKIDVEGHEGDVLAGAGETLQYVAAVVVECQQERSIFEGAPSPFEVASRLEKHGLRFHGIAGAQLDPQGEVVQFDGVWVR